jgi:alpha-beta hydrolase superfamily lysophospholipase
VALKVFLWIRTHRWLTAGLVAAAGLIALNVVAFNQAWSMTHFQEGAIKTANPESLSLLQKVRVSLLGVSLPRPQNTIDPRSVGLAFETHRFGGAEGDELEAWHIPCEKAKGIVLFAHGYGACKASLLLEARALHGMGYAALLLDFHGSGGSRGNDTSIGVHEADDLSQAVESVRRKFPTRRLILYGQSMGSAAILRAIAVNGVRPDAVIVECPFDRLLSTASNRFAAMGLPAFPAAHLLIFWGGVQHGFNAFRHNPVEYARNVRCPVLLLHGAKDARVTQAQAESIFQNLPGDKEFIVFPNAGHESYLGAAPGLWTESVSRFLERHQAENRSERQQSPNPTGRASGRNAQTERLEIHRGAGPRTGRRSVPDQDSLRLARSGDARMGQ